jgi:hypothetical protein
MSKNGSTRKECWKHIEWILFLRYIPLGSLISYWLFIALLMSIAFPYVKIIDLDDVYVAIVAHKLKITLLNNKRFAIEEKKRTDVEGMLETYRMDIVPQIYTTWKFDFVLVDYSIAHVHTLCY